MQAPVEEPLPCGRGREGTNLPGVLSHTNNPGTWGTARPREDSSLSSTHSGWGQSLGLPFSSFCRACQLPQGPFPFLKAAAARLTIYLEAAEEGIVLWFEKLTNPDLRPQGMWGGHSDLSSAS